MHAHLHVGPTYQPLSQEVDWLVAWPGRPNQAWSHRFTPFMWQLLIAPQGRFKVAFAVFPIVAPWAKL
jgi:hypothetical protein